ncbi:MAG: hypothetical protein Ct9H300mP28_04040 [Pseudomonadota bacterium]|nr:MAG: hypothetical protein Ct9H300mP28_04040 [Pseudomonadota bacterium]
MLEELLEKDGQDSLISYVHQNQFDSEIGQRKLNTLSDQHCSRLKKKRGIYCLKIPAC